LTGERVERRLAAVLAADVAGYSRLMGADEEGTLARLKAVRRDLVDPTLARHRGRIVKTTGDGILVEFASAVDAVRGSAELQRAMAEQNATVPVNARIEFRIGIHVGDIIIDDNDIFGDGVNIAARLESIAEPGGVCISDDAYRQIRGKIEIICDDLGSQILKNITEPMRTWQMRLGDRGAAIVKPSEPVRQSPTLALPDKPSIAVLPFQNMSGDPDQNYFADGMVEDLIAALSAIKSLFVIARGSTFIFKDQVIDYRRIGRELGVEYLLEGSVRKVATKLRIAGQLVEADTGRHVWSGRFDGDLNDLFELQDRITQEVAGAIEPTIRSVQTVKAKAKPTNSLSAYDHYLLALDQSFLWTQNSFEAAQEHLKTAVKLDPAFSLAKATGSLIIMRRKMQSLASDSEVAFAIQWAREALSSHKDDPNTLRSAGQPIAVLGRDFELGLYAVKRAVEINPNAAGVLNSSGWVHAYIGAKDTAVDHFLRAIRLSPLDPEKGSVLSGLALAHFIAKDYDEAVKWAMKAIPEFFLSSVPVRIAAISLAQAGRIAEARQMAQRLLQMSPDFRIGRASIPARDQDAKDRFLEGLRLAGLPE
jgi:TolB-like protein/class 3 adenylate cyclase/tetratricopeptide (TPR) repeat protein